MHTLTKNPVIDSQTVFDHFDNQKTYSGLTRYCDSKLVVNAFVRTLSSHVSSSEVIVNNPCPGSVATGFDKQLPAWLKPIMFVYRKVSARNVEEGSRTLVYAASVAGPETHGKFLQHNKIFEGLPFLDHKEGSDFGERLWAETVQEATKFDHELKKYVTSLENRMQQLEALLAKLLPDGDVESALSQIPSPSSPDFNTWVTVEPRTKVETTDSLADEKEIPSEGPPDDLPILSNGFEWSEQDDDPTNYIADGMAALSVDPQGAGYLGSAANVSLLRSLQRSGWCVVSSRASLSELSENPSSLLNTWSILLQPSNHRQLRATLIDAYFYHYHTAYPIVHEATFRAQYNEILPKPSCSSWELLRNTILCIGAWCLGHDVSGIKDLFGLGSQGFKFAATFSSGNLIMVQALMLWSNYNQRQNKPNTSWNYQGLAVRMALSLGLHKEFPAWNISLLDREIRRRVWWFLYIVDSGASMTFGRPVLLPEAGGSMDIKLFLNVHDDCLTAATTETPEDANEPTVYSGLLMQAKFHLMANPLYARRIGNPDLGVTEVMSMNSKISSWMLTLPYYFQESANLPNLTETLALSRYRLFWRVRNFRMLLLWPILIHYTEKTHNIPNARENEMDETARQLCLSYAHDTITSIDEYLLSNISGAFGDWYALYYLIQSSLIPIIAMLTVPESPDAVLWTADIETTKRLLSSVVTHQELARKFLDIVNRFWPSMDAVAPGEFMDGQQSELLNQIYTQFTMDSSEPQFLWQGMYESGN
ncbi:hypothetical protein VE00_09818 [Pseudogymnoascus sp. WSF 3629]|nr:hypothetical protein VE00_09818 [Pseudogymnoascus sp. WSF 3629]